MSRPNLAARFFMKDTTIPRKVGMKVKLSPWHSEKRRGTIVATSTTTQGYSVVVNWDKKYELVKDEIRYDVLGPNFTSLEHYDVIPVGPLPKQVVNCW